MDVLIKDFKFAARMLVGSPGFTLVAVLTLGLGIGANTAIFSVVNSLLLDILPYEESDRLVWLRESSEVLEGMSISYPNFVDWRDQNQSFEAIAAHRFRDFNLTGTERPEQLLAAQISHTLFPILRVEPLLGRNFAKEEDEPDSERVVILGYGLWERRFGGDPELLGGTISLDGEPYTVIGVMPPDFLYPPETRDLELYLPIGHFSKRWMEVRGSHPGIQATARLEPGVSFEQAQADMATVAKRLEQEYPDTNTGHTVAMQWLRDRLVEDIRPALLVLLAAVGFVLLIACANVANLLLARAAVREQEIAIRTALGAGRRRLVRQLLTESVLLSLIGGALGVGLAIWGIKMLLLGIPEHVAPIYSQIGVDGTVLGFTLVLSVLTGLLFGTVPALLVSRSDLSESLKEGGRSTSGEGRHRLRSILVVSEVALALVLLIGAALLMRSFFNVTEKSPGFNPEDLLTMNVSLPSAKYKEDHQRAAFFQALEERVKNLPGADSVALSLPLLGGWQTSFVVEGRPVPPRGEENLTEITRVTPDYFQTMEIPLLKGRTFTDADREDSLPVAIVDQTLADSFWPGEDPIGKRFKLDDDPASDEPWLEVVGVVGHVKNDGVDALSRIETYLPYRQSVMRFMTLLVRTTSAPTILAKAISREVQSLDPEQPVSSVMTMEQYVGRRLTARRLSLILLGVFAGVALILATVGIYGLMAYSVNQRTHEIGIRLALGAQANDVLKMVMGQGVFLALLGVGFGLMAAFALTPLMSELLFGVSARDPVTYTGLAIILASVAVAATFVPAHRATKVAPMVSLRYE
jgi:putative ABC transport system permease protein